MNRIKTATLLAALSGLLLTAGNALAGRAGLILAFLLSALVSVSAYWWSERVILTAHNARRIDEEDAPGLHSITRELARRGGLPMPRLYLVEEEAPNAFATGRNPRSGAIAVTEGLLELLKRDELAGVLAHELGHIQRRDTLLMGITAALATVLSAIAPAVSWRPGGDGGAEEEQQPFLSLILWLLITPVMATLIQLTIYRTREFLADELSARLVGDPLPLARALAKIEAAGSCKPLSSAASATAHLFIRNPLSGGKLDRLFQTHPPTTTRIERLESMALRKVANFIYSVPINPTYQKDKTSSYPYSKLLC